MGNNVFILLSSLNWEESSWDTALLFLKLISSFFWGEVAVNTHQSCHSSHIKVISSIMISEPFDEIGHSIGIGLGAHIKKDDVLGIQKSAETLEKP